MAQETDSSTEPDAAEQARKPGAGAKPARGKQAVALAHNLVAWPVAGLSAVLGWFGRVLGSPLGKIALLLLVIYIFAPVDRLVQWAESKIDDRWHAQSREGLIVVDTPQLFTRERLINERLEESAWIEDQLRNVDTLLEDGKFAQVDSISVTQSLLSIIGQDGGQALPATDLEKLGELAEKLGTTEPSPLEQFRDAKNYRERLNLQRYDSILDDAHDIGSNTLHRMNFRLTLSPARPRSDSVAAVSISVREPRGSRILFDHYGRLMVETRKKMEETVDSLLRDRMLILNSDFQFQTSELELIDYLLKWQVIRNDLVPLSAGLDRDATDAAAQRYVEKLVNEVLHQQRLEEETKARAYLHTLVTGLGIPTLSKTLLPNYPNGNPTYWNPSGALAVYGIDAPKRMIEACGRPFKLTELSPNQFSINNPTYQRALSEHIDSRLNPAGRNAGDSNEPPGANDTAEGGDERVPTLAERQAMLEQQKAEQEAAAERQKSQQEAARDVARSFAAALDIQFVYPCPQRENRITVAKLRLLGRMDMLQRVAREPFAACTGSLEARDRLIAFIGMDDMVSWARPIGTGGTPGQMETIKIADDMARDCPGSHLYDASVHLAERLRLTGGDYAQIGIVQLMKAKLENLPLDSSSRTLTLGQFFDFDIERCDLKTCKLRTRTKAETMSDEAGKSRMVGDWPIRPAPVPQEDKTLDPNVSTARDPMPAESLAALMSDVKRAILLLPPPTPETIAEAGREEALRLFLELRCFADARSYTVWPRSGERLASYERDSMQSGAHVDFGTLVKGMLGLQAGTASDTIMRQERDHIFGIGDWGRTGTQERASGLVPCSRELEAVLDAYEPNGTFIRDFVPLLENGEAPPAVTAWWESVLSELNDPEASYCDLRPCDMSLEMLMRIAQAVEEANTSTKFSWIIAPRRESPLRATRHVPLSVPLSALISLPSWWGHAELDITTCWVRPKDLKERIPTGNLCGTDEATSEATRHTLTVPLPGKAQDVLQRIGFFIIRTPYLDTGLGQEEEVEAGRPARIRLTGSRLWKNPRVRIGNQWHDRIEVLPNMQGVIATFNCIHPTIRPGKLTMRLRHEDLPRYGNTGAETEHTNADCAPSQQGANSIAAGSSGAPGSPGQQCAARQPEELYLDERQAEIWTSEGRTSPTVVKVHAFRPRYFRNGEMEQPCWLKEDNFTGMALVPASTASSAPPQVGPNMPPSDAPVNIGDDS